MVQSEEVQQGVGPVCLVADWSFVVVVAKGDKQSECCAWGRGTGESWLGPLLLLCCHAFKSATQQPPTAPPIDHTTCAHRHHPASLAHTCRCCLLNCDTLTPKISQKYHKNNRYIWSSGADGAFTVSEEDGENEDLGRGTLIKIHLKEGEEVRESNSLGSFESRV